MSHEAPKQRQETAHTPTPWGYEDSGLVFAEDGNVAALSTGTVQRGPMPTAEFHANGRFIVTACNSHDALVAALRELLPLFEEDIARHEATAKAEDMRLKFPATVLSASVAANKRRLRRDAARAALALVEGLSALEAKRGQS